MHLEKRRVEAILVRFRVPRRTSAQNCVSVNAEERP